MSFRAKLQILALEAIRKDRPFRAFHIEAHLRRRARRGRRRVW